MDRSHHREGKERRGEIEEMTEGLAEVQTTEGK